MKNEMRYQRLVWCLLLLMIAVITACEKSENTADAGDKKLIFYTGMDIEPVYSQSFVESQHSRYEFEPVLQGDIVHHDFIIKNNSQEILELKKAEGCCGLFVESFSRQIRPGMTGKISLLILTDSRGGQEISGTVRADTNDKNRPEITIDVSITVKEFASLSPYRIWLKGTPEDDIVEKCTVLPNESYPFKITGIKVRKGVWFDYSWKEIELSGRNGYEITVKNTRKKIGSYQDVFFCSDRPPGAAGI